MRQQKGKKQVLNEETIYMTQLIQDGIISNSVF